MSVLRYLSKYNFVIKNGNVLQQLRPTPGTIQIGQMFTNCNKNYNFSRNNSRTFKNFGHKPEETPRFTKYFHLFIGSTFLIVTINWKK